MTYVFVVLLGVFVGWTELLSRYRDAPFSAVVTRAGFIYLAINGFAAAAALFLLDTFEQDAFQNYAAGVQRETARVLIAGFGAVVVLRSSLFRVRVDQSDISVGPAAVLDVLLRVADRDVDRTRALMRAGQIPGLISQISSNLAIQELPALCLGLMQNLTPEEQRALSDQVNLIKSGSGSEEGKAVSIGLLLSGFVGLPVLTGAIDSIKKRPSPPLTNIADQIKRDLDLDRKATPIQDKA